MKKILLFGILAFQLNGSDLIDLEGYAEGYILSPSHRSEEQLGRFVLEPSVNINENVHIHSTISVEYTKPTTEKEFTGSLEALEIDFKLADDIDTQIGKVHVPVGLYNLYHEPTYFLTIEPSRVEHLIIPTEWHEMAFLSSYTSGDSVITVGAIAPINAQKMISSSWILEGTDYYRSNPKNPGFLARFDHGDINTFLFGGSYVYIPIIGVQTNAQLLEIHASKKIPNGLEFTTLLSKGWIGDTTSLNQLTDSIFNKTVQGAYATLGYDISNMIGFSQRKVVPFWHIEYAKPTSVVLSDTLGGTANSVGLDWFFTPKLVAKIEYRNSNIEGERIGFGFGFVY